MIFIIKNYRVIYVVCLVSSKRVVKHPTMLEYSCWTFHHLNWASNFIFYFFTIFFLFAQVLQLTFKHPISLLKCCLNLKLNAIIITLTKVRYWNLLIGVSIFSLHHDPKANTSHEFHTLISNPDHYLWHA